MPRLYPTNIPSRWAAEKVRDYGSWWSGEPGQILRRMAAQALPGVPAQALMGFAFNGHWQEDTALSDNPARFHELGAFGITGGPRGVPAPNCDRSAENDWCELHNDEEVVALLGGRSATMQTFQRGNRGLLIPLEDQIAIGVVSLKRKAQWAIANLPADVAPSSPTTPWAMALSFMGWSAGPPTMKRHVSRYYAALRGVPEPMRWAALLEAASRDPELPRGVRHNATSYSLVRTQQKWRAGALLASQTGGNAAWFGPFNDAVDDVIARAGGGFSGVMAPLDEVIPWVTGAEGDGSDRLEEGQQPSLVLTVAITAAAVAAFWYARRRGYL